MKHRSETRTRAVLKGEIRYNNGLMSAPCLVRDISLSGARIELNGDLALPDRFDLHIAKKNVTHDSAIKWRRGREIGVSFSDHLANRPTTGATSDTELADRVIQLEREVNSLKSIVRKIKAERWPE